MDNKLFESLLESNGKLPFIGPCDRVRQTEAGEAMWQEMMKNRVPVDEGEFLSSVDLEGFLDDGETWDMYRDTEMQQDPEFQLYRSGDYYFIQTAGFEMIFGPKILGESLLLERGKVVDKRGRPLVVYHGTGADFEEFDASRFEQIRPGDYGAGFYFTNDYDTAEHYANMSSKTFGEGRVIRAHITIENPYFPEPGESAKSVESNVSSGGHDGVIVNRPSGRSEFVVHSADQIEIVKK